MKVAVLAPGSILQYMYLRERLRLVNIGQFIEIGPGSGEITQLLLELGWKGVCYEMNEPTVNQLKARYAKEIENSQLKIINGDFLKEKVATESADLIISCMVMEHLDDNKQSTYLSSCKSALKNEGTIITIVPGSQKYWGIEDDIAGHYRRYSQDSIKSLIAKSDLKLKHISGLTFPISNLLFPISNFLVNRSEKSKISLSMSEKTKLSGNRNVPFKTSFPNVLKIILNEFTMWPFHILQKLFHSNNSSMVIYFEAKK